MAREEKQWQVWCPQLSAGAPRCAELYAEPSAPLQPARRHWGSRKNNFLPIIIFPIMSQIRKKPLAESNDGNNFVSRTKLDTILVFPWGLRKRSRADRYQQQRSTKCTCRLQENKSLFHAQWALLARCKQSGARQRQHKVSIQLCLLWSEARYAWAGSHHTWSKGWLKQRISPSTSTPVGGSARASAHPGAGPKAAGRWRENWPRDMRGNALLLLPTSSRICGWKVCPYSSAVLEPFFLVCTLLSHFRNHKGRKQKQLILNVKMLFLHCSS